MKATGIVRRIDDLGRVVIPKEIRRTMRIREGDPLEIYTDRDGSVIFKKYSLMGGLTEFAGQLCDTLNRTTGRTAVITDRDNIISVSGAPRRELMDKQISPDLERLMEGRQIYQHKGGEDGIPLCDNDGGSFWTPWPPSCPRGMCWAAWCSPPRRRSWGAARWSTSWPSPSPPFWASTWRADIGLENRRGPAGRLRPAGAFCPADCPGQKSRRFWFTKAGALW